jgi:hypothetical protein
MRAVVGRELSREPSSQGWPCTTLCSLNSPVGSTFPWRLLILVSLLLFPPSLNVPASCCKVSP